MLKHNKQPENNCVLSFSVKILTNNDQTTVDIVRTTSNSVTTINIGCKINKNCEQNIGDAKNYAIIIIPTKFHNYLKLYQNLQTQFLFS